MAPALRVDRTNNYAEASHRRLQSEPGVQHPNIWRFINGLRKAQKSRDIDDDESMTAGQTPERKRRRYRGAVKTNQRESYIGPSHQHAVKDPRPLSDKLHMRKCVTELIQILGSLNYPNSLTPKSFNPPSTKEYQRVFEFLSYEVMGNYRMLGKPDEEMIRVLKDLGYPYSISKSNLSNVGALSCWPHALGALVWLGDLAQYCNGLDDAIEETLSINTRNKLKQEFNSRCYDEFMTGSDGPFTELVSQLKTAMDDLDADALKALDELKLDYNRLAAEYDKKIQEKETCYNLVDEIQTKRDNIQKLRQYVSQCDEYISAMNNNEEVLKNNLRTRENEIEALNQKLVQLKATVSQQEMSPADLESIIREKQQLRDSINATSDRLEHLKTSKWDLDVQIGKLTLKADELAAMFNNNFKAVSNSVELMKDFLPAELVSSTRGGDFTLALGHKGNKANEEVLTEKIQPFQTSLNTKIFEIVGSQEAEYYNLRKRVKQDAEILTDLTKEKEQLQEQYQKLLKESETQKEELQTIEEANNAKIIKAETSLEQLKSADSESIEDMVTKLNETKEKTKNRTDNHAKVLHQSKSNLQRLANSVKQFQLTLHERVQEVERSLDQIEMDGLQKLQETKSLTADINEVVKRVEQFIGENK